MFPTAHALSKYRTFREALQDDYSEEEIETMLEKSGIDEFLRENEVAPPSITKESGRRILKQLTTEAGIDVEGGY